MSGTVNTSEVGSYLTETTSPLTDPQVMDVLTATIVGITKLDPTLVRPRWQPTPPNQPAANVDWCAVGVIRQGPHDYPYEVHDPNGNNGKGQDIITDYVDLEALVSFYGPNAQDKAGVLRRGLNIGQNRWPLYNIGVKVTEIGQVQVVPDQVNLQIIDHVDVTLALVREVITTYNIETILSASGDILTDTPPSTTHWDTTEVNPNA